eukprot:COSAG01_NODE_8426_length_2785_cov_1.240982_4_plen_42_part_01
MSLAALAHQPLASWRPGGPWLVPWRSHQQAAAASQQQPLEKK